MTFGDFGWVDTASHEDEFKEKSCSLRKLRVNHRRIPRGRLAMDASRPAILPPPPRYRLYQYPRFALSVGLLRAACFRMKQVVEDAGRGSYPVVSSTHSGSRSAMKGWSRTRRSTSCWALSHRARKTCSDFGSSVSIR